MENQSFIHDYKGIGNCDSKCKVEVITDSKNTLIVFTDMGIGTSVTNASEALATEMVKMLKLDPVKTLWAERYIRGPVETLDQIHYSWNGSKFYNPRWRRISGNTDEVAAELLQTRHKKKVQHRM